VTLRVASAAGKQAASARRRLSVSVERVTTDHRVREGGMNTLAPSLSLSLGRAAVPCLDDFDPIAGRSVCAVSAQACMRCESEGEINERAFACC
jgi:hypothetical protein